VSIILAVLLLISAQATVDIDSVCASAIANPADPVSVQAGDQFAVSFDTQPGTGYSWSVAEGPDPSVVVVLGTEVIQGRGFRPGASESQCFAFEAVGVGDTWVNFAYARPFEPEAAPDSTASASIIVSAADAPTKQRVETAGCRSRRATRGSLSRSRPRAACQEGAPVHTERGHRKSSQTRFRCTPYAPLMSI
jgi:predicted secreted protein